MNGLTFWMKYYRGLSVIQIEPRRWTATYILDQILLKHVSNSNGARRHTAIYILDYIL